jgi:CheY-like chemotaxis protein
LDGAAPAITARVVLIVMTAASDSAGWAAEVGATGHLAKPFEADDLIATVARALHAPG